MNESIRSGMAVLEVAIPTGYIIQQQRLDSYILSRRVRNLQRAKYNEKKVIFYFDFVSSKSFLIWNATIFLILYFSWITMIFVLTSRLNDGIQLLICLVTCLSGFMITMLQVKKKMTKVLKCFNFYLIILQNDSTRRFSTLCQPICLTFARCVAAPNARTVQFTTPHSSLQFHSFSSSRRWPLCFCVILE